MECRKIGGIGFVVVTCLVGCYQPVPDDVHILGVTKTSPTGISVEIETLEAGTRTTYTGLRAQIQFLIDQVGPTGNAPPTSWTTESFTWLPGPDEDTRLFEVALDAEAVGVEALAAFDRVVVTATAWANDADPEEGISREAVFFFADGQFRAERPNAMGWDVSEFPPSEFGAPMVATNQPADPQDGPSTRVFLHQPRRVDTVIEVELGTIEDVNVQAWFATSAGPIDTVTIPAGETESPGIVVSGPPLTGFSQSVSGPQWDGTTNALGQGPSLVFSAFADINGLETAAATKAALTEP